MKETKFKEVAKGIHKAYFETDVRLTSKVTWDKLREEQKIAYLETAKLFLQKYRVTKR